MPTAIPRIPIAPRDYRQMEMQQILSIIQTAFDELQRRGISTGTQTTVGTPGSADAVPGAPTGYAQVVVNGQEVLMPYYNKP